MSAEKESMPAAGHSWVVRQVREVLSRLRKTRRKPLIRPSAEQMKAADEAALAGLRAGAAAGLERRKRVQAITERERPKRLQALAELERQRVQALAQPETPPAPQAPDRK